ncbi:MAG TPA: sulfotransferase [Bacteroidia bacterium]|jgi:hypothetical protein|nr:sulfotransferase [Bacteroidia bacterium]
MKIFGLGLSRTGTTSLYLLMESLGYSSRHFIDEWMNGTEADVPQQVLIDTPVPYLYKALDEKYPGSKFILTIRNKESWLESMRWMFVHGKVIWNWPRSTQEYNRKFYKTTRYNKKILSRHYDTYHKEVELYFRDRPGDLLVVDIDKGVSVHEICDFLSIPRQEMAFPRTNERRYASLTERIKYNFPRIFNPY